MTLFQACVYCLNESEHVLDSSINAPYTINSNNGSQAINTSTENIDEHISVDFSWLWQLNLNHMANRIRLIHVKHIRTHNDLYSKQNTMQLQSH